jgi:CMP-N,N'-diacetyllegionaminic acid synthase|tara:strand:- start:17194 stop:17901 length:708 start_codon:yes stop_codon:yes gene_type:complete
MFKKKKILAIIPARSGSKGIKNKNLKKINNISLVGHAIECLKKIKEIDYIHISTDGKKIFKEAKKYNLKPLFYRPNYLSGPKTSDIEVIEFVLKKLEYNLKIKFDIILLVQPTSPLRIKHDIIKCINLLITSKSDSVWSLSELDLKYHPLKQIKVDKNRLDYFDPKGKNVSARQYLNRVFYRNGICYAITRHSILNLKSLKGRISTPYIVKRKIIDIDTPQDILEAKLLMKKKNI